MKTTSPADVALAVNKQTMTAAVVVLILALLSIGLSAQSAPTQFLPFKNFVANSAAANSGEYLGRRQSRVRDASAFEEMRQHILTTYEGVEVGHSFVEGNDYIDCVPIEQQPSVRLATDKTIKPPPPQPERMAWPLSTWDAIDISEPSAGDLDQFGNSMRCEQGSIPMLRMTLEQLTRFETLADFFRKGPGDAGQAPAGEVAHKYAHADQTIDNLGGSSRLNLWSPEVDEKKDEVFSLSQMWYSGGKKGDAENPLQTVEGGWQNYPKQYGDQRSRLFIFWTSKDYEDGSGCYNLTCPGFKQVDSGWSLGTPPGRFFGKGTPPPPFDHYSEYNGAQYGFTMEWYLYKGDWWLGLARNDGKGITWVGYYPGALFNGHQMSRNAKDIDFGGETAGDGNWGPMGSGHWPDEGFKKAAFQDQIQYTDLDSKFQTPTLTKREPSRKCYKLDGPSYSRNSLTYFYFGGPGGATCE